MFQRWFALRHPRLQARRPRFVPLGQIPFDSPDSRTRFWQCQSAAHRTCAADGNIQTAKRGKGKAGSLRGPCRVFSIFTVRSPTDMMPYFDRSDGIRSVQSESIFSRASSPAWPIRPSCSAVTPLTPMAPMTWPSTVIGNPPSNGIAPGRASSAVRPPPTAS